MAEGMEVVVMLIVVVVVVVVNLLVVVKVKDAIGILVGIAAVCATTHSKNSTMLSAYNLSQKDRVYNLCNLLHPFCLQSVKILVS